MEELTDTKVDFSKASANAREIPRTEKVSVTLTGKQKQIIDELVGNGVYKDLSDCIRDAVRHTIAHK